MKAIESSELILNQDGSVYHLSILPEDISDKIIFVGDPERVAEVSQCFEKVEIKKQKREFVTHTGLYKGKRISVISTGIGTDNIDIVMNELDALKNIDLKTRTIKENISTLQIMRLGTSGSLSPHIPVDTILISEFAIGMDSLLNFYDYIPTDEEVSIQEFFSEFLFNMGANVVSPYVVKSSQKLMECFSDFQKGITMTNCGFYAPQGRQLRSKALIPNFLDDLSTFTCPSGIITNLEMETAGIYGMSKIMGHDAISVNVIIANRATKSFSADPQKAVKKAINKCLDIFIDS